MSKLRCFLRKTAIPYYRAKEEVANYEPRISLFHDVISPSLIDLLKSVASKGVGFPRVFVLYEISTVVE